MTYLAATSEQPMMKYIIVSKHQLGKIIRPVNGTMPLGSEVPVCCLQEALYTLQQTAFDGLDSTRVRYEDPQCGEEQ